MSIVFDGEGDGHFHFFFKPIVGTCSSEWMNTP